MIEVFFCRHMDKCVTNADRLFHVFGQYPFHLFRFSIRQRPAEFLRHCSILDYIFPEAHQDMLRYNIPYFLIRDNEMISFSICFPTLGQISGHQQRTPDIFCGCIQLLVCQFLIDFLLNGFPIYQRFQFCFRQFLLFSHFINKMVNRLISAGIDPIILWWQL